MHFAELSLGDQQARADPAFDVIAVTPALHVAANGLYNRERRLDHVGAGQACDEVDPARAVL